LTCLVAAPCGIDILVVNCEAPPLLVLLVRLLAILLVVLLATTEVCWYELLLACLCDATEETYIVAIAANAIPIPNVALERTEFNKSLKLAWLLYYLTNIKAQFFG
jgi:hypothetical protein